MSGLTPVSLTLYLRPLDEIEPYLINDCARELVRLKYFKTFHQSRTYLRKLENNKPFSFKAVMSNYLDHVQYKQDYKSKRNVNLYRSTNTNIYGEDKHMYASWSIKPGKVYQNYI